MTDDKRNPQAPQYSPEYRPGAVPEFAEYSWAINHFRAQYHPLFHNEHDMPDHNGPREYLGIDYCCVICMHIQPAGEPGKEHKCEKCGYCYFYTALKGACWLWFWKDNRGKLILSEEPADAS